MDPNAVFVQCGPVPLDGTHQQSNAPPPPHPHRPAPHLPNLPFEVIRRIIHHRLALPDSVPEAVPSISAFTESNDQCEGSSARPGYAASRTVQWDDLAGHAGRQAAKASRRERREVMRDAAGMMLVCKAWKVGLYTSHRSNNRLGVRCDSKQCTVFYLNVWMRRLCTCMIDQCAEHKADSDAVPIPLPAPHLLLAPAAHRVRPARRQKMGRYPTPPPFHPWAVRADARFVGYIAQHDGFRVRL